MGGLAAGAEMAAAGDPLGMSTVGLVGWVLTTSVVFGAGRDVPVPAGEAFAPSWQQVGFRHDLWNGILADHVDEAGLVDYRAVRSDGRFSEYLYRLANTDPAKVGDAKARLAFWINAYNALVVQGVLHTLPADPAAWSEYSVLDVKVPGVSEPGKGFFVGLRFVVGGRRYALDEIEKAVLLHRSKWFEKKPGHYRDVGVQTPDPRIHFALVCAARGCVALRREAYETAKVDAQLDEAVRRFARDEQRAAFDRMTRTMRVSQLLDWYGEDLIGPRFAPHAASVPKFLARYVEGSDLTRSLAEDTWKIVYIEYDWKLNFRR